MKTWINLLPLALRRQQLLRTRAVQWSKILCAGAVVGWLLHGHALREQAALAERLTVLSRAHEPTQTMLKQLIDIREQLVKLEQQEAMARELEHQRQVLAVLGVVGRAAQRSEGRLQVTEFTLLDFQSAGSGDGPGNTDSRVGTLALTGLSLDNGAVAEMLDGLQSSGLFARVELIVAKEREGAEAALRDYEIRCEF